MSEPDLEALLKNFADGGWETLAGATDRGDAEQKRRVGRQRAIADDVLWLAHQPQGRRVIEWLFDASIRRASWHGDLRFSIEQSANYGLLREGQNSMAAMVLAALRHATGGDVSILQQGAERERPNPNYGAWRRWQQFFRASWRRWR